MQKQCDVCGESFETTGAAARYCGERCRKRAQRNGQATKPGSAPKKPRAPRGEPELVKQVRLELEEARALDSVLGQLALQLASRVASAGPAESGFATLVKEFRATRAEALGKTSLERDPVDEVRERRERKRQAARGDLP